MSHPFQTPIDYDIFIAWALLAHGLAIPDNATVLVKSTAFANVPDAAIPIQGSKTLKVLEIQLM